MEQSYDAVDREVTLGNRYDYCCWELEKISTDEFEDTEDYVTKYGYETDYSISFALGMLSSIGENTAGSIAFDRQGGLLVVFGCAWQSMRLLTAGSSVRARQGEPNTF